MTDLPHLSLCMPVKDEASNLEKYFLKMWPTIQKLKWEVVVVDTGSTDATCDIFSRLGIHVWEYPGQFRFDRVRNYAITHSRGQWIFFLDADEWIETSAHLEAVDTLTRTLAPDFTCIRIQIENIRYQNQSGVTSFYLERIFRRHKAYKYVGAIHAAPVYEGKAYTSPIVVKHFGYVMDNKALMAKKFARTQTMLLHEIAKHPDGHPFYTMHLANSYSMHGDHTKSLKAALHVMRHHTEEMVRERHRILPNIADLVTYGWSNVQKPYLSLTYANRFDRLCPDNLNNIRMQLVLAYRCGHYPLIPEISKRLMAAHQIRNQLMIRYPDHTLEPVEYMDEAYDMMIKAQVRLGNLPKALNLAESLPYTDTVTPLKAQLMLTLIQGSVTLFRDRLRTVCTQAPDAFEGPFRSHFLSLAVPYLLLINRSAAQELAEANLIIRPLESAIALIMAQQPIGPPIPKAIQSILYKTLKPALHQFNPIERLLFHHWTTHHTDHKHLLRLAKKYLVTKFFS